MFNYSNQKKVIDLDYDDEYEVDLSSFDESSSLAHSWKKISISERLLYEHGVDVYKYKSKTPVTKINWKNVKNIEVRIFDGGVISIDGNLLLLIPREEDILNNIYLLTSYQRANMIYNVCELFIDVSLEDAVVSKDDIFNLWNYGYLKIPGFSIIIDET